MRGTHTVLVVDDDDDVRDAVREVLEDRRYFVVTARSGRDAIRALSVVRVGLILLDLSMPEMDGWTFLDHKAANLSIAALPVIVVTAVPEVDAIEDDPRVAAVLRKPLGAHALVQAVRRYLVLPEGDSAAYPAQVA
jgi:two-component system, chemotaxis family, chemotaxis protein CheY